MPIHIIQHGTDGFGHQLHGLFSTMILHNCKDYYFDGIAYLKKKNEFDHISGSVMKEVIIFIRRSVLKFIKEEKQKKIEYEKRIHSHEIYKIPKKYDQNILYSIDNAYYFDKLGFSVKQHSDNIEKYSSHFRDNLKKNEYLKDIKSIVIHVRLGDSVHREGNHEFRKTLIKIVEIFKEKYPSHKIFIHSDGEPNFLEKNDYTLFDKKTPVIKVLSDFVFCNILVCCISSLSSVASFLTNAETILIPNETKHSTPSRCVRFNQFINETGR